MKTLYFLLYACTLTCALLGVGIILQDLSAPAPNLEGTLVNIHKPGYAKVNRDLCRNIKSFSKLLILVSSAPGNFDKRQAIRLSWGHFALRHDVIIGFFLGAVTNSSVQGLVEKESTTYMDIIQNKNIDSYRNLTLKSLSMLQWVNQYCPGIGFILKSDDDVFINVRNLLSFVDTQRETKNTIFGNVARNWKPIRSHNNKYYVSDLLFQDALYPSFATGPAYLMTQDVPARLTSAALMKAPFPLEDVFFTGIVAEELNIKRINNVQFHPYFKKKVHDDITKLISIHKITAHQHLSLWNKVANDYLSKLETTHLLY
ncbi:UDP-GlcNAc:betaGal beta-1,3-N-acetylglucosaminyltransferase 7-like [Bacillus rossius redtenbacheri]|uniref:UDP-GlcNAc:betaGal beta-1,3-N-acetylglucosaminyltransferase 7-like n=1 Tax=Bacillus rossius redtenbacheri TaxID=93214 RepID=UPI002FDE67B4